MPTTDKIKIERDSVYYGDNILKISNISRMCIIKFFNKEKQSYQNDIKKYENDKRIYESLKREQKNSKTRNCVIAAILFLVAAIFIVQTTREITFLLTAVNIISLLCMCGSVAFIIMAVLSLRKNITYPYTPPAKKEFSDRHGLIIEMNSGHSVIFTALDDIGKKSLLILRDNINDAGQHQGPIIFNMSENHIAVENNDGIIDTGTNTNNTIINKEYR